MKCLLNRRPAILVGKSTVTVKYMLKKEEDHEHKTDKK